MLVPETVDQYCERLYDFGSRLAIQMEWVMG